MRRATGRPVILAFHGSYHGESTLTAALGAEAAEISRGLRGPRAGLRPRPLPATRTGRRCATRARAAPATRPSTTSATTCSSTRSTRARSPGVMIEPVLGSGGCVAPPDSFWPALVELCREHGWLLCADEVKSGMGRAGRAVRGRALGRRARPDLPRQGARRRGDADRRAARLRARAGRLRRRAHRQHLGLAARLVRRGARDAGDLRARAGARERARARSASAPRGSASCATASSAIGDVRAVGCFMAIEFVARPRDQGAATPSSRTRSPPRPAAAACSPTRAPRRSTSSRRW